MSCNLKASLQHEVIRKRIKQKGARGRAWRKAHDYLRDAGVSGVEDEPQTAAAAAVAAPATATTPKKSWLCFSRVLWRCSCLWYLTSLMRMMIPISMNHTPRTPRCVIGTQSEGLSGSCSPVP
mmetsp:Transcript_61417/g.126825  ORF Transcript_61417/g.126825 Transcript_61417/m.126825 type:complete len:123 (-) Transcript_61417:441-809(-)